LKSISKNPLKRPKIEAFAEILAEAHQLADISGPVVLRHFRRPITVENKAGGRAYDPVTIADKGAERAISKALKARFPDHGMVGEEYGVRRGTSPFSWVIDPIDGTRSFVAGSPLWGTLIGVLRDSTPFLGLVDQPYTGERFWSAANASFSRCGGRERRIKTRLCGKLGDAVFTTTHPDLFASDGQAALLAELKSAARMTRYGGDCYGYCMLAAGFVDLIVEPGLKSYDIVALIPIIERAGGCITTWDGGTARNGGDIVASGDPRLHEAVLKRIARL